MAYKKPQIVAKSAAKKTFVAGCPTNTPYNSKACCWQNERCLCGPLK